MTIFDGIFSNFRNNEDNSLKNSRFQTEALNMIKIMHKVLTLPSNRFYALFSDEALSGTQIEPAVELLKRFYFKVAKKNNILCASATHHNELVELEVETRGVFKNLKVDALHLPDGKLYRPHKILPGIGESSSAFDTFSESLDKLGIKNKELSEMIADAKSAQAAKDENIDDKTFFPATYFF
jgi:DNA mismatch repair ATPase MutS